jgi:membrane fusion protein, copper/silver efflux system
MRTNRWLFLSLFPALLLTTALVMLPACKRTHGESGMEGAAHLKYHCGMHPQIVSDKPGQCPICRMDLTPFHPSTEVPASEPTERKPRFYRNPMNPSVTSPVPMKDNMGMDYIPVYDMPVVSTVPGQAVVQISPGIQQLIGMKVTEAAVRELTLPIRAAAKVAYDPGLYSATVEYQEAQTFLKKARSQGSTELIDQAETTVRSSELRLRQMGLSDEQIEAIRRPGYNASGLLLGNQTGSLEVYAAIFDDQAGFIHRGQDVGLTAPALPGKDFHGRVEAVDRILNSDTRTLRVRIHVNNAGGSLRPEMYLSATIQAEIGRRLAIPDTALLDTGTRQLVYVETSTGTYRPREVRAGQHVQGFYEIISGLREGERVAASANFLIDSESRIQSAGQP